MTQGKIHFIWQIHQPFFISNSELEWRLNSTYIPLIDAMCERKIPFSLNITGGTLERLNKQFPKFIEELSKGIRQKKFILLGSAAYHPLLPFLSSGSLNAQLQKDIEIKNGLNLKVSPIFWPTELGWSWRVGINAMEAGYKAVIIDSFSRNQINTIPFWDRTPPGLVPNIIYTNKLGTTPILKIRLPHKNKSKKLLIWVRERTLSDELVKQMSSPVENSRIHLNKFLAVFEKSKNAAQNPTAPLIVAEDAERILPNSLGRFLDLLDNLLNSGVEFVSSKYVELNSHSKTVKYIPASTMEGEDAMWLSSFDDKLFKEQIERISIQLENLINFANPKTKEQERIRDRLLRIQDSGFYFWRYIPRTREPFYRELHFLEQWISNNTFGNNF